MFVDLTLMLTFNDIHTLNIYIPLDQLIHKSLIHRFIQDKRLDRQSLVSLIKPFKQTGMFSAIELQTGCTLSCTPLSRTVPVKLRTPSIYNPKNFSLQVCPNPSRQRTDSIAICIHKEKMESAGNLSSQHLTEMVNVCTLNRSGGSLYNSIPDQFILK